MATGVARQSAEETAMATEVAPETEEKTVVFPDWVMLDRLGRTYIHADLDAAAREAANKKKTAVEIVTATGHRCCLSFALSDRPEGISYLDLHWPPESSAKPAVVPYSLPAYPYVRATDEDLVLFDIDIDINSPSDLFVYTAGPSPSVQRLPLYTGPSERPGCMRSNSKAGILRLAGDHYIVSDLNVVWPNTEEGSDNYSMFAELCVFDSKTEKWAHFLRPQQEILWSTDAVLAFDRQFICWVDYLMGVLLCDFSNLGSPVLQIVHFPGKADYSEQVEVSRCLASRFRTVAVHQGMLLFVHIENDYDGSCQRIETSRGQQQQPPPQKITIWTLNLRENLRDGNSKSGWKIHRQINLHCLWAQLDYQDLGIGQRLPEFPVFCAKDPDALCCLLRDERKPSGQPWMIMIDMNHAYLRSCTEYINERPYGPYCTNAEAVKAHKNFFSNIPLLPTVFSKYLVRPTGIPRDNNKVTTPLEIISLQCEDEDLESGDWDRDILDFEI
ncbi:hypothetical protein D1007_29903 [Hordeum vulgare]|nr:hypothetical protein D1007_29903 [Hordeum vulgare]